MWSSTYSKRVELALKIKAIPFEYVEENLSNKSDLLLKYNPVYKKIPVLVHQGKPIAESLIILEYIDETWNYEPRLLPDDPYERATIRFRVGYVQQILESMGKLFNSEGEAAQKIAIENVFEKLRVLEKGIKSRFFAEKNLNFHGQNLDLLDIIMVATLGPFRAQEEFLGVKIIDPEKYPLIFKWITNLIELPVVKEITPPQDELVSFLHKLKQAALQFPTN